MLIPSLPIGSSLPQVSVSGFCGWAHNVLSVSQMPEKSGFPSGARGVRAVRLGFPSAVFGTPAVGYFNHWAPAVADHVRAAATPSAANAGLMMYLRMIDVSTKRLFYFLRLNDEALDRLAGFEPQFCRHDLRPQVHCEE